MHFLICSSDCGLIESYRKRRAEACRGHERRRYSTGRGLAVRDTVRVASARTERLFMGFDDVRRRLDVPAKTLLQAAEADGYRPAFNLEGPRRAPDELDLACWTAPVRCCRQTTIVDCH